MHPPGSRLLRALLVAATALIASPLALRAQADVPALRWRTIETAHFRLHFEPGLEDWTRDVAAKLESVRSAVARRVDYTPPRKIDIIVEDPYNVPNGSAWPSLHTPAMRFWATPPAPSSVIGNSRGWGEILSVHEYAHLAHLLRPSREPFAALLAVLGGLPVGPITFSPAWVTEGYATLIEGELTGAGRPNGVARPAILRQLALEGYLPAYGNLGNTDRFNGGAMRYLVGSAYLDWLQAQRGDSALSQLWRRMTARESRDFPTAFRETFGDAPDLLYGRFTAELTRKAFAAQTALEAQGLATGTLVQRWAWSVGTPAISPDGKRVALRRASPKDGARILVLSTEPAAVSSKDSTRIAERLERDPQDLPAYAPYPRALKTEATLHPTAGASYDAPRWFADGRRLLVTRAVPRRDGRVRPDLFVWDSKSGKVRRITKGAGILQADVFPDGAHAAALTCGGGTCGLVLVDLTARRVRTLAAGRLDAVFSGVRVSPSGRMVASARQRGARWDLVVVDVESGAIRRVGPNDGATRHSPSWEGDSALVVVSEASGVPTLERVGLDAGARTVVARTLGGAYAPEVGPDGRIWWLDQHGRGYDLRVNARGTSVSSGAALDTALYPAVQRVSAQRARTFDSVTVAEPRAYGVGPMAAAIIGGSTTGADGDAWNLGLNVGDVLARTGIYAIYGQSTRGAWEGWRGAFTWRGFRPTLQVQVWDAEQRIGRQGRLLTSPSAFDVGYQGVLATVEDELHGARGVTRLRVGYSDGRMRSLVVGTRLARTQRFAQLSTGRRYSPTATSMIEGSLSAQYTRGELFTFSYSRIQGEFALAFTHSAGAGLGGRIRAGDADVPGVSLETFYIGGMPSMYVDPALLDNRITHPGLPFRVDAGRKFAIITVETPGPIRLYHDWISAGNAGYGTPTRVVGGELRLDTPRLGVFRLPAGSVRTGLSHVLNGSVRNATIGYASLILTP